MNKMQAIVDALTQKGIKFHHSKTITTDTISFVTDKISKAKLEFDVRDALPKLISKNIVNAEKTVKVNRTFSDPTSALPFYQTVSNRIIISPSNVIAKTTNVSFKTAIDQKPIHTFRYKHEPKAINVSPWL